MAYFKDISTAKLLAYIYDIFTAIVSLLDVITDIIVLVEFYVLGRMAFFYTSLSILIIAQFAYCIVFWWKFRKSFSTYALGSLGFCCMLPFAPILSFAFFFTENDNTRLSQCLHGFYNSFTCQCATFQCCLASDDNNNAQPRNRNNNDRSPEMEELRQWVKNKLMKHMGFIIEALIEAFPQSILQLIAIVYFNDSDNYISMLSILLSMLSVSTKSFILSVVASFNWTSAIFNWLSCITDFFGIFFIISFAFYVPPGVDGDDNPFQIIQSVWIYSIVCTVIPFALIGSIGMNVYWTWRLSREYWIGFGFFVQLAWIVGLCICIMGMTITCFVLIAAIMAFGGLAKRTSVGFAREFYLPLIPWIKGGAKTNIKDDGFSLVITKKQDKIIRICCINRVLFESISRYNNDTTIVRRHTDRRYKEDRYWTYNKYEKELHEYLIEHGISKNIDDFPYKNVSLKQIKLKSNKGIDNRKINEKCHRLHGWLDVYEKAQKGVYEILDEFMGRPVALFLKHFCFPLYLLGRGFNIIFVLFIICYLSFGHSIHVFTSDIPLFQTVMFCCYILLLSLWILTLIKSMRQKYILSFILPSTKSLRCSEYQHVFTAKMEEIENYYDSLISQPFAQRYCVKRFGNDIAILIMQFYGNYKGFDVVDEQKRDSVGEEEVGLLTTNGLL